jgi:hypothetical protein
MKASAEELRAWLEGHRLADELRRQRVAEMSHEEKLGEIAQLMAASSLFDMSRRIAGDEATRALWQRLRASWASTHG